jgi:pimeloyl-ACP methyl ester carboxylesterase
LTRVPGSASPTRWRRRRRTSPWRSSTRGILRGPEDLERALLDVPKAAISSETFRPKDAATLAAFGIDNVVIPGTGHYLMLERPSEFNERLARVLDVMAGAAGEARASR